jgi:hypothetical protein
MAAWARVPVKMDSSMFFVSDGKGGGGALGYFFAVQSYCPPSVVQRSFLLRSWVMLRGLWMLGSRGRAMGSREDGGKEKNDEEGGG